MKRLTALAAVITVLGVLSVAAGSPLGLVVAIWAVGLLSAGWFVWGDV